MKMKTFVKTEAYLQLSSVQLLSHVCLRPHGLQLTRPPCPAPTPGGYSNSCPWSQWCHPAISSSVVPFSSHLQSFQASGFFPMNQFFTSGGQRLELQLQHQSCHEYSGLISFRMDWFNLLAVQWTLKSLLQRHSLKELILQCSDFMMVQLSHPYVTIGKTIALTIWTFVRKVTSLLFNMLSNFLRTFLPRSRHLWISWLQSPFTVILEPKKIKYLTISIFSPSICHEVIGLDDLTLIFWTLSFKPAFSLSSFTFIKRPFSSSSLSAIRVVSSAYLRLLIFLLSVLIPAVLHPTQHFVWCTFHRN